MAENPVTISVVMPVFYADRFLEESIESILHQTYTDFELIIICSEPSDETKRILTFSEKKDPRVHVTYQEKNGIIHARNTGCSLARGDYIAVMDADDISLPDRLKTEIAFLENHPDIGIVGSWADIIDESGRTIKKVCPPADPVVIGWYLLFGNCMVHLTVLMRSDIQKKMNGYTPGKNGYPEDYDLWARAFFVTRLANIPETLGKYRIHAGGISAAVAAEVPGYCAGIQDDMIRRITGDDAFCRSGIPAVPGKPVLFFNPAACDAQVRFLEMLYRTYMQRYVPSDTGSAEIRRRVSQTLLSYSWSVFPYSKMRSVSFLSRSLWYSKSAVFRKMIEVIRRNLGFP